jgi:GntR family transcriptional regulator of vanillate catabolism
MVNPVPLSRDASQTDRAILGIRDLLLRGKLQAGERVTELALADVLGVSRTPIRAALQKLAEEGLLEPARPSGYLVRAFSDSEVFDAIEVRGTLEGLAARMAAERGVSQLALNMMRDCLAQIDAVLARAAPGSDHLARYAALNARFHKLILEASGSDMVAGILARVVSLPFAAPDAFVSVQARIPGSIEILRTAQMQHYEILGALEMRSSARVEPLVREHARIARKNLELALRDGETLRHLVGAPLVRAQGRA